MYFLFMKFPSFVFSPSACFSVSLVFFDEFQAFWPAAKGHRRENLQMIKEEEIEKLEQIRWLKNGWQIGCNSVQYKGIEINTPEDLEEWHNKNSQ